MTVQAIFENGVFRPTVPVSLPDHTRVEFDPKVVSAAQEVGEEEAALQEIYRIMEKRYRSGHHDTAERHNEHQP